jgi:hypothetical protein
MWKENLFGKWRGRRNEMKWLGDLVCSIASQFRAPVLQLLPKPTSSLFIAYNVEVKDMETNRIYRLAFRYRPKEHVGSRISVLTALSWWSAGVFCYSSVFLCFDENCHQGKRVAIPQRVNSFYLATQFLSESIIVLEMGIIKWALRFSRR